MVLPKGLHRADHVGSLLRPKPILETREKISQGSATQSQLHELEDTHIADLVAKQLANGIRSITDGELRRAYFHLDYLQHLDGVRIDGQVNSSSQGKAGFMPPRLVVDDKLGHPKSITVDDFRFLEKCIKENDAAGFATSKVCLPSPTMVHFRGGRSSISKDAYPELEPAFFDDLARVYQEELQDLYDAGCRFVQLDDTNLAYLCDTQMRKAAAEERGEDLDALPMRYAELINKAIGKRPKDMNVGIHLCRGNYRSQHFASGGYEPVAEVLFKHLNVDVYFLEYDDVRSGDFAPLRFLAEDKYVVLGVMSSKKAELDDREVIVRRLKEAAEFVPRGLDQLCVSHQCGFSSTMEGNELSEEQQFKKLALAVSIAKDVWGEDLSK